MRPDTLSTTSRRGFLTPAAIVAEARGIAEADGLEHVSMRALAERLGCTPRALYRHVEGKDGVLELVADSAFADLVVPPADVDWPAAFLEYFTDMRRLLVEAPAIALIIAQLPVAGTTFRAHADALVGRMVAAGVAPAVATEAVIALAQYTLGAALPGTGDALLGAYRRLRDAVPEDELPAFQQQDPGFTELAAEDHFRSALRHLVRGYAAPA